jgi:predicted transcriptional regulator
MSVAAIKWASRQKIRSSVAMRVLLSLAEKANRAGECFPSQATIAGETGYSKRSVEYAMKALEEWGFITRKKRGKANGKGRCSDLVTLALETETAAQTGCIYSHRTATKSDPIKSQETAIKSDGYLVAEGCERTYSIHSRGPKKILARKSVSGAFVECDVIPFPKLGDAA